jgi:hypothetical protein
MCTLSVVTRDNGYLLGMNRDERIARGAGAPPETRELGGTKAIYPSDGASGTSISGSISGTWIGANEHAMALALLNWGNVTPLPTDISKSRSRGLVIPTFINSRSLAELRVALDVLELAGMLPFRLVGVFPSERQICEWRWNSGQMDFLPHGWEVRHWFSSSLSDKEAERFRGAACHDAWSESNAGSAPWLRRLHASHAGGPGPFSLCVHRSDVRTLSYSEIECTSAVVRMGHFIGSPCAGMVGDPMQNEQGDKLVLRP